MNKITGLLSALLGAGLVASITLNFCFYRDYSAGKQNRMKQEAAARKKAASKKSASALSPAVSRKPPKPETPPALLLYRTGHSGYNMVYARFTHDETHFANLSPKMITVKPALPFEVSSDPDWNHIKIKADFQPETEYTFLLHKGLETTDGLRLLYDAEFTINFPERPTSLKPLTDGLVFPLGRTNQTLPLELSNTEEIQVTIYRLYENNLLRFPTRADWYGNMKALDYGKEIGTKRIPVRIPRNKEVNYALELSSLFPAGEPGVYGLVLSPSTSKRSGKSTQMIIAVTDLAPQCVIDKLNRKMFASVHRLSNGAACAGAEVRLVSSKFQVLASGITDAFGMVRLDYGQSPAGTDPRDYPSSLLVKMGKDLVFQQGLSANCHSLAEFESSGNPVTAEPRALVYTERGVYRPGEKIYVTAWVRNPDLKVYADAPCQLKILDSSWNTIYTKKVKTSPEGAVHESFTLPEDVPGGKYTVWCQPEDLSTVWGESGFLAADFMPDRIKVQLKPAKTELTAEAPAGDFTFAAEYYFGSQLKDAPYHFTVTGLRAPGRPEWKDWSVGSKEFSAGKGLSRSGRISGKPVTINYPGFAKQGGKAFGPVLLAAAAQVSEPGGRAVTAHSTVIYHPTPYYLGLKQESEQDQAVLRWKFFPAVKKSAAPPEKQKIELAIFRNEWKYVLKKSGRRLVREWVQEKVPVGKEVIETGSQDNGVWRKKLEDGSYEIIATCGEMRTDIAFWHGYGEGGAHSANPSVISCTTDKEVYLPGENAKITLKSGVDGTALIAAGSLELHSYQSYPIKKGSNVLTFKVPAETPTSACYAGITLVSGEQRQFGLVRFKVKQNRHKLAIALDAPETAMPKAKIKVKISLSSPDGQPQQGTVQLFAVDEGILSLTGYSAPDIFSYFYGTPSCEFIFTDIYGILFPDLKIGKDGKIGGDGDDPQKVSAAVRTRRRDARQSAPESAIVRLPLLKVNGTAETEVSLPDHLGAMRLIAVASAPDRVGSAERILKMRDRLDIMPSGPAVCAPGDEAELTFALFNHDLPNGKAQFELTLPDGKKVSAEPLIAKGKSAVFRTLVKLPAKEGVCTLDAVLRKDGIVKSRTVKIPLRYPNPAMTCSVCHTLKPGEKWDSSKSKVPVFASDAEYTLTVSASAGSVLKDALSWLNDYPYGCLEQTVSGAFPFISADSLEKSGVISPALAATAKVKANLAAAKILSMMLFNGSFPMWPGGVEAWPGGTVYAAHFLQASGNLRNSKTKSLLAGYLTSLLQKASASRYERAYAGYVLALMDDPKGMVLSGARNILKSKEDDYASFLAAAALSESGYSGEAYPHLKRLLEKEVWRTDKSAPHFSGPAARAGMTLYILMKLQADAPEAVAKLRQTLLKSIRPDGSGWGVTHANAWAVLGLAELERRSAGVKGSVSVTLPNGEKCQPDPAKNYTVSLKANGPAMVENTGSSLIFVQYRIKGVPVKAEPVRGALKVHRTIQRPSGAAVTSAKQGELLTVRFRVESTGAVKDMVLSSLLPGGLEIEDERFVSRAKVAAAKPSPKQDTLYVKQVEKRPGEFVVSGDLFGRGSVEITCQVRAVSRGKFSLGSTSVEAMYEPGTRAFEPGNGTFEVK